MIVNLCDKGESCVSICCNACNDITVMIYVQVLLDTLKSLMTSQNTAKLKCLKELASGHQLQSVSLQ